MTAPVSDLTLDAAPLAAPSTPVALLDVRARGAAAIAPRELHALTSPWEGLAARAVHPAVHSEAAWLGSLVSVPGAQADRALLLASRRADGELAAVAALRKCNLPHIRFPLLRSWDQALMFSGAPLLDAQGGAEGLADILREARTGYGARAVLFHRVEADPALRRIFEAAAGLSDSPLAFLDLRQCAALRPSGSFDTWFEGNFPRKRRKELRRLRARLAEKGCLTSESWREGECLDRWIDEFLCLERSGWKGRRGTAMDCDAASSSSLRACLGALAKRDELAFWKLALNGRPVAMLFAIVSRGRAWLIKMAYEEELARFSPGVLITLDATEWLFDRGSVALADSCAAPNHPMIDHLWRDRLSFEDVLIATPGASGATFRAILGAERARRRIRQTAKSLYYKYIKGVSR